VISQINELDLRRADQARDARVNGVAVNEDGAGAALPQAAAEFRAAQPEIVAQDVEKRRVGIGRE
jgi:hypothetical protein